MLVIQFKNSDELRYDDFTRLKTRFEKDQKNTGLYNCIEKFAYKFNSKGKFNSKIGRYNALHTINKTTYINKNTYKDRTGIPEFFRSFIVHPKKGVTYILLNRHQLGDKVLGKGGSKKVKMALGSDGKNYALLSTKYYTESRPNAKNPKIKIRTQFDIKTLEEKLSEIKNEINNNYTFKDDDGIVTIKTYVANHERCLMISDYYPAGDFKNILKQRIDNIKLKGESNKFSEEEIKTITTTLVYSLYQMHKKNFVHRDMKPANILVEVNSSGFIEALKTTDLESAIQIDPNGTTKHPSIKGTPGYLAPETVQEKADNQTAFSLVDHYEGDLNDTGAVAIYLNRKNARILRCPYDDLNDPVKVNAFLEAKKIIPIDADRAAAIIKKINIEEKTVDGGYTVSQAQDIWAVGCIFKQVLTTEYDHDDWKEMAQGDQPVVYANPTTQHKISCLIWQMLDPNPNERPTIEDIIWQLKGIYGSGTILDRLQLGNNILIEEVILENNNQE